MKASDIEQFVSDIGPYLLDEDPLGAMKAAGLARDGELLRRIAEHTPAGALTREQRRALKHSLKGAGAPSLSIGPRPDDPPSDATGFGLAASLRLGAIDAIMAELHRVNAIPPIDPELIFNGEALETLRELCTGVPDNAELGKLTLLPITFSAGASAAFVTMHATFILQVGPVAPWTGPLYSPIGPVPGLIGGMAIQVPLEFELIDGSDGETKVRPRVASIFTSLTGAFTVSSVSSVRPRDEAARQALELALVNAARIACAQLVVDNKVTFRASIPISKKQFPRSRVNVVQIAARTVARAGGGDCIVIGANVERERENLTEDALADIALPTSGDLHLVVDDTAANDAVQAIKRSGDLLAFFKREARNAPVSYTGPLSVDGERVRFLANEMSVGMDITFGDVCALNKDLTVRATVRGKPTIDRGRLKFQVTAKDLNLDNYDAIFCALTSGWYGLIYSLALQIGLPILAASNPTVSDLDLPFSETSDPLPQSDRVVKIDFSSGHISQGVLTAEGALSVIRDPTNIYVYLRLIQDVGVSIPGMPAETRPVVEAKVQLYELDKPAPAGDDAQIPASGTSWRVAGRNIIRNSVSYAPRPDEILSDPELSDPTGRVTFVVTSDMIAGTVTEIETKRNLRTQRIVSESRTTSYVYELPDLAITVHDSDGAVLASRKLVALNALNKRVGKFEEPIVVRLPMAGPIFPGFP